MQFPKKASVWRANLPKGLFSKMSSADLEAKLMTKTFISIDDMEHEESSTGFTSVIDIDNNVKDTGISFGEFFIFALRTDTRKIDKKAAKVMLEKEIKKSGKTWSRESKKDRLEQIISKMMSRAVPIPSASVIAIDHAAGVLYTQATSEKKVLSIVETLAAAIGFNPSDVSIYDEDIGQPDIIAFMEGLWAEGTGNFQPKKLSDEAGVSLTGDDPDDLALGKLKGKICISGTYLCNDGIAVDISAETLRKCRVAVIIDKDSAPEDEGEFLAFQLEIIKRAMGEVEDACRAFSKGKSADVDGAMRAIVESAL